MSHLGNLRRWQMAIENRNLEPGDQAYSPLQETGVQNPRL